MLCEGDDLWSVWKSRCSNNGRKQSLERGTGGSAHDQESLKLFIHRMERGIEREGT